MKSPTDRRCGGGGGDNNEDQDEQRPRPAQAAQLRHMPNGTASGASSRPLKRVSYFCMEPKTELQLHHVDGRLLTHLILAFARISPQGQLALARDTDRQYLEQVAQFKRLNPGVRVLISVANDERGEFNAGFQMLALANNELRNHFAKSAIEFLKKYHLDGLDLHWEFPNFPTSLLAGISRAGEPERAGLTKILRALRSSIVENFFDRQLAEQHEMARAAMQAPAYSSTIQVASSVEPYLLTLAVGGQESILRSSYELKQVTNLCDWLNVMSYDYFLFKAYSPFTGPVSPLHSIVDPFVPFLSRLSLDWTVQRLLEEDLDRDKLVMGIPSYARAYKLIFRNTTPAAFTLAAGTRGGQLVDDCLNYREVIETLARDDTIVQFDEKARVPYLLTDNGYTWISYENARSVREKVRYILDNRLGGYMTWNLNSDDFAGDTCGTTNTAGQLNGFITKASDKTLSTFPLHRAMLDEALTYVTAAHEIDSTLASSQ